MVLLWLIVGAVLHPASAFPTAERKTEPRFSETAVKAVFIYNLTRFISWPALPDRFRIAVLGDPELTEAMRQTVAGERHRGRKIIVTNVYEPKTNRYHIVFVSKSCDAGRLIRGNDHAFEATLTISDIDHTADQQFMVYLQNRKGRISLALNPELIRSSGIYVSPQILRMSRIIRTGDKE